MIGPLFSWLKRNRAGAASGREAGRREVEAIEALRETVFVDREQAALHAQLARAPRDAGALFGLLQWHARRGEREEVEALAHILWDETDAEGGLWKAAAALGRELDPDNPLYGEDPFKTLGEHAMANADHPAPLLPFGALDLSMPDFTASAGSTVTEHDSLGFEEPVSKTATQDSRGAAGSESANWLSVQTAQLPSSVLGLSLDLDGKASGTDPFALFKQISRPADALTDRATLTEAVVQTQVAMQTQAAAQAGEIAARPQAARTQGLPPEAHGGHAQRAVDNAPLDRAGHDGVIAPKLFFRPVHVPAGKQRGRKKPGK